METNLAINLKDEKLRESINLLMNFLLSYIYWLLIQKLFFLIIIKKTIDGISNAHPNNILDSKILY